MNSLGEQKGQYSPLVAQRLLIVKNHCRWKYLTSILEQKVRVTA